MIAVYGYLVASALAGWVIGNFIRNELLYAAALFAVLFAIKFILTKINAKETRDDLTLNFPGFYLSNTALYAYVPIWFLTMAATYSAAAILSANVAYIISILIMAVEIYNCFNKGFENYKKKLAQQEAIRKQQELERQQKEEVDRKIKEMREAYFERKKERDRKRALEKEAK